MATVVSFQQVGGPEVLQVSRVEVAPPGQGEVRIRQTAIGVNYIDTYHRSGLYPVRLPFVCGTEAAGVVEAIGPGVESLAPGDRVAYTGIAGAYASERNAPADQLVRLPEHIDDVQAASMMLKGLTVHYLIHRTRPVQSGDTVLWHAAAGGVGLIACQWLAALGVNVIATVGSDDKAVLARAHGATHVINYVREDFVARVREITGGRGVPVVFDSVGKDTWEGSLECLQPLGMMVSFGNASGAVPPINIGVLANKGSLFLTRPTLATYIARREDLDAATAMLFDAVGSGKVRIQTSARYALEDAAQCHRDLEARRTTGSVVLLPA